MCWNRLASPRSTWRQGAVCPNRPVSERAEVPPDQRRLASQGLVLMSAFTPIPTPTGYN